MATTLQVKVVEADFVSGGAGDGLPSGFTTQWANGTGNGEMVVQTGGQITSVFTFTDDADGYSLEANFFGGTGGAYSSETATVN